MRMVGFKFRPLFIAPDILAKNVFYLVKSFRKRLAFSLTTCIECFTKKLLVLYGSINIILLLPANELITLSLINEHSATSQECVSNVIINYKDVDLDQIQVHKKLRGLYFTFHLNFPVAIAICYPKEFLFFLFVEFLAIPP